MVCHLDVVLDVVLEKFVRGNLKRICDGDEGVEAHALQPAFDVAEVGWRLVDDLRELLLGETATLSDLPDVFADLHRRGHSAGEMALLLGGMPKADVYASALRARGLACVIAGGSVFASTVEANVVLDLVRVMANPFRTQTLHNVLTGPLFELCAEFSLFR